MSTASLHTEPLHPLFGARVHGRAPARDPLRWDNRCTVWMPMARVED